jgi:Tol biopolymer transport system component
VRELGPGTQRVNELVWSPDGTTLYAHESNYPRTEHGWFEYDPITGGRQPSRLMGSIHESMGASAGAIGGAGSFRNLSFGEGVAAFSASTGRGAGLFRVDLDTRNTRQVDSAPRFDATVWHPDGTLACVRGESRDLVLDCGGSGRLIADGVYDRVVIDRAGRIVFARPDESGTLDLWESDNGAEPRRLTRFGRDAYAPYLIGDGELLFRVQDYRISLATIDAAGGEMQTVTTFQSETPSWDRDGTRLAFTYGTWRRKMDDAHYPDIDQHVGIVELGGTLPAEAPHQVVRSSYSEDQGMHWSPDGRWIVLHSHADSTDDLWLQPADGSLPAWPITEGGHETGWPRWSEDGRTIIYPTEMDDGTGRRRGRLLSLDIDPITGEVVRPAEPVPLMDYDGSVSFAEFASDGEHVYFESNDGIGQRSIRRVNLRGGTPEVIHRFESEQWFSAIAVSPDGQWLAYVAPGADGKFQLHRVPAVGGEAEQITIDATDKTHPTWSPAGDRIAFSVFNYESSFWRLRRR